MSRSTWACELKFMDKDFLRYAIGHAPRERVSWNWKILPRRQNPLCHAPRERVSWNFLLHLLMLSYRVTLHVSVWVEICKWLHWIFFSNVTLHVSVWVEIGVFEIFVKFFTSRSTWACELKLLSSEFLVTRNGHAPRERVSWNILPTAQKFHGRCHAPRERVSWNCHFSMHWILLPRHAPRERVSWNITHFRQI